MFIHPSFWSLCQSRKIGNMKALSQQVANTQVSSSFSFKNIIVGSRVVDQDMGDSTDAFAILNNRRAGHVCVNIGPKLFLCFSFQIV